MADALRAERAEAVYWATYARNLTTTGDTRDTGAVAVAGGYAICLQGSSMDYGLAVGTARALREDDLRIVDEFYGSRDLPSRLELHPHVATRDERLLWNWGYRPERLITVLEREIGTDPHIPSAYTVEIMTARHVEWIDLVVAGCIDALRSTEIERARRTAATFASAANALVGIRLGGQLVGGGAVGVTGDAAFLFCASTLPQYRRRGVYSALVAARLAIGRSRGATFAFTNAPLDSAALAGAQAGGFTPTYVRRRLRKD